MKKTTRLFALLLSVLLVLTMALPVFAAEDEPAAPSITINNAIPNTTYKVYKILDLISYDADTDSYLYKVTTDWNSFFEEEAAGAAYITVDEDRYARPASGFTAENVEAFAAAARSFADSSSLTAAASGTTGDKETTITIEVHDLGYYLVESSIGIVCSLTTAMPTAEVNEKNEVPTITKKAKVVGSDAEEVTGQLAAQIGDVISFTLTVNTISGNKNYIITDEMGAGLTWIDNDTYLTAVSYKDVPLSSENEDYFIELNESETGFIISIGEDYSEIIGDGTLTVTYYAQVNENAEVLGKNDTFDGSGRNTATLTYDNHADAKMESEDTLNVYTWQVEVYKYGLNENSEKYPLANAKFAIYSDEECEDKDLVYLADEGEGNYRVLTPDEIVKLGSTPSAAMISRNDGRFRIQGLGEQTYYLKELEAPDGYSPLKAPVKFTVSSEVNGTTITQKLYVGDSEEAVDEFDILNQSGSFIVLPETGGAGTVAFVVIGCIAFIGTAVVLVTKKRMYNEG